MTDDTDDSDSLDSIAEKLGSVPVSDGYLRERDHDDGESFGY